MKRIITTIAVLAVSVAFVATAQAGKKPAGEKKNADPEEQFKKLDTNGDGFVSKEEFAAHGKGKNKDKADAQFAKLDRDGDGKLSKDEFLSHGKKKKNK